VFDGLLWSCALSALALLALLAAGPAEGPQYVQLLDPSVLGQAAEDGRVALQPLTQGEERPAYIGMDLACGRYIAALVRYWPWTPFDDVRASLNRELERYEKTEVLFPDEQASWVVGDHDPPFNILLSRHDETGSPEALYISEAPEPLLRLMKTHSPESIRGLMPWRAFENNEEFAAAMNDYCAEAGEEGQ